MKKILITGANGMIGQEIAALLSQDRNNNVIEVDLKFGHDLREYWTCKQLCNGVDEIFHLAGVKGNPKFTAQYPLEFLLPMLQMDSNIVRAALENNVQKFLYTSSIAVLYPTTDKYPAWAKRTGEVLIEAVRDQCPTKQFCVVRPGNVYGKDNFKNPNAMVVTSLIRKAIENDTLEVWGTGGEMRDFVHARDVAVGMIKTMEAMPREPINLCTGVNHSIRTIVEIIRKNIGKDLKVIYDGQSVGAQNRPIEFNGNLVGFEPKVTLEDGIKEAIQYARETLSR